MSVNIKLKLAIWERKPRIFQWELAKEINKSPQWLSLLINNRVKAFHQVQEQISRILGKRKEELFDE